MLGQVHIVKVQSLEFENIKAIARTIYRKIK